MLILLIDFHSFIKNNVYLFMYFKHYYCEKYITYFNNNYHLIKYTLKDLSKL